MKKIVATTLVLLCCAAFSYSAFAVEETASNGAPRQTQISRAEETQWVYRTYAGQFQKRLWSVTYSVWRTDWIPV